MYSVKNKITIIEPDNKCIIDGYVVDIDCSELDDDIWAVAWNQKNKVGEIEYNDGKRNKEITNVNKFQPLIDKALPLVADLIQIEEKQKAEIDEWEEYTNSFDYKQLVKIQEINNNAQRFIDDAILSNYPKFETLTFEIQRVEAEEWNTDNSVSTPSLDLLADARGVDRVTLIRKVIDKSNAFRQLSFYIAGLRQAKITLAEAAKTEGDLNSIDLSYTLPK